MRATALFALSSGCFAAGALGTPFALALVWLWSLSTPALVGVATVVTAAVLGATVWADAAVSPETAERFRDHTRALAGAFGVVGLLLLLTLAVAFGGRGFDLRLLSVGLCGTALALGGFAGMIDGSQSLHTHSVVAGSGLYVPLPNAKTDGQRRVERWNGAASIVVLLGATAYVHFTDESLPVILFVATAPGIVQLLVTGDRERAITDAGLLRGDSILPWCGFEGYERSQTHLTLRRDGRESGIRIRRDRIDDEESVLAALAAVFDCERRDDGTETTE